MKAATSMERFDERRRFTRVGEQMGRVRLDSDANELTAIWHTEHRRRSADLAEGSPDDGFRPADTHLVDPITSTDGWSVTGLAPDDERVIRTELGLVRRDPDTLPRVIRVRGTTRLERTLPRPLDLLHLPVPSADQTYQATALVLPMRFVRPRTDDEVVATRIVLRDGDGGEHLVDAGVDAGPDVAVGQTGSDWIEVRVEALAVLPRTPLPDGGEAALLTGWGLAGLPPRAEVYVGGLLADPALGEADLVLRGGDGTLAGAGRLYNAGRRSFIEQDWRHSLQPDLPDPEPLARPAPVTLADGSQAFASHLLYLDVSEVVVHGFEDGFLREPALDGEDTAFRTRQLTQVRAVLQLPDERGRPPREPGLPSLTSDARLSTVIPAGLPDRFPAEQPDLCRDRCLSTENAALDQGYTGSRNLNVRVEVLATGLGGPGTVVGWSRDNAATVVRLRADAPAGATRLLLAPPDAARFTAGDVVVVEDRRSRLDPGNRQVALRRLRAVDTAEGVLELEPAGHLLATDPASLDGGGGLPRAFHTADAAAVRRWDGADWYLTGVRYNLADGLAFALAGAPRVAEYWTFTARVVAPDGAATGVVEPLDRARVRGPAHWRVPIGRVLWSATGRELVDLRRQFLPLQDVRDRLVELGARRLSPGAFTVVVGDGVSTFGDIDQNIEEGVTGDEAIQAAVDRLGTTGGTVYIRKGEYTLEHPVLVQGRSNVRILGDGDATTLTVTGAGGAFYVDWCGHAGDTSIELMRLVEAPEDDTPLGSGALVGDVGTGGGLPSPIDGGLSEAVPLTPADLPAPAGAVPQLIDQLADRLRILDPFAGRAAASVVRTIAELRRLQRLHPGRSLEESAPDQLAVLRGLPHGVVTVTDSTAVTLERLHVTSRNPAAATPLHAGVLLSGTLQRVAVRDCAISAPSGVVAAPYARFLLPAAIVLRPRGGLAITGLAVTGNHLTPLDGAAPDAGSGVRIADGILAGVRVEGNQVEGFGVGIAVEDQAELRVGEPVDRTVVRENAVVGSAVTGISVTGDGVDIAANEVRLGAGTARLRAGVRVAGAGCRVTGTWVTLPAPAAATGLGVEAGVLIGRGVETGSVVGRPVYDVEISANRVEGAEQGGAPIGVLIGGAQPISQVRIGGNALRSLGGAGVRAWGHLGVLGDLRVEQNTIEAVALADFTWTGDLVTAVGELAPGVDLTGAGTPRDVLDRLLAPGAGDRRVAIDAVLSWLEQATLRGGVVLDLVDGAVVADNRIVDVGTRAGQAAAVPDAPVQTAGIAVSGGSGIVLRHNTVERIRGIVVITPIGPIGPPIFRPPVLDVLRRLELARPAGAGTLDVHGSVVALRGMLMEYTAGGRAARQQLGGRIYATMDAVAAGLEQQSASGARLAEQLAGAVDAMRDAQGTAAHTRAANLTRAVLSDAAALTAPADDVAAAWNLAARFDRALLGEGTDIVEAANEVADAAPTATTGLEDLQLPVAEQARAVIAGGAAGGGDASPAQLQLATTLGTLAEGRAKAVALASAMPVGGPTVRDTTLVEGTVRLTLGDLEASGAEVTDEVLRRVQQGSDALASTLDVAHTELAARLRADLGTVLASQGRAVDLRRLTGTLRDIQRFAADPATGARVRVGDVADQRGRFGAELAILTADRIDRQVAELSADTEAEATRNLRLVQRGVAQLVNLVADRPAPLRAHAAEAAREVVAAIEDPDHRQQHRAAARAALQALQSEQARLAGVTIAETQPAAPATDSGDPSRLPALVALMAELPQVTDPEVRADSLALLDSQVRRLTEALGMAAPERASLLSRVAAAASTLSGGAGDPQDATAALADVLDELADRAARVASDDGATAAVRTLTGALTRVVTPRVEDRDRLLAVQRWVTGSASTLSPSVVAAVTGATDVAAALGAIRGGLATVLPLPLPPFRPLDLPFRIDPQPADGLFAAGVSASLAVGDNAVRTARGGAVVAGGSGHPLAPLDDGSGLQLAVEGNRIVGAALFGIELRPPGVSAVDVIDNEVSASAGLAEAGDRTPAGAVVVVAGSGELVVARNRLRRNGDRQWGRLLHELMLDWRGDVTVQDNVVRHTGAGAGGAGVLVLTDPVPADLVRRLAQEPALTVEPPALTAPSGLDTGVVELPDLVRVGLGDRLHALRGASTFGFGGFRIAARQARPVIDRLQVTTPFLGGTSMAVTEAQGFRDLDRPLAGLRLIDLLRREPPRLILPWRPARRAVHVTGNDVVAAGPALLLLCDGPNLASATVVGNELESTAPAGAVYLRQVDTTVFSSNRCECLPGVTVTVLRGRNSMLTVTGNVVLGAEPAPPPPSPLPPVPTDLASVGDLTLSVAVGPEASVTLPLDAAAMLDALDANDSGLERVAAAAQSNFAQFAQRASVTADPRIRQLLATGTVARYVQLSRATTAAGRPLVLRPRAEVLAGLGGTIGRLGAQPATPAEPLNRADPANPAGPVPSAEAADPAMPADPTPTPELPENVQLLVSTVNQILGSAELDGTAKLFGLATTTGMTEVEAKAFVQAHLAATGGNAEAALARGLSGLTGVEDTAPAPAGEPVGNRLLEDVVGLALRSAKLGSLVKEPIGPRAPRPLAEDPRRRSLVVLGGSRVGVVNNITTAGAYVRDAGQSVENNL